MTGLDHDHLTGWTVRSTQGDLRAEMVVNTAGQWAREVGELAGISLPICSLQHHYLVTERVAELSRRDAELPVLRDTAGSFYVRQEADGLLVGPFERRPRPFGDGGIPAGFHNALLPPDLDQIGDVLTEVSRRIPMFGDIGIRRVVNGPDGYTPDGHCLLGPVSGAPNFHVAAGFSIFGIVFAGGIGRQAAEWIVNGEPSRNVWPFAATRFGPYARSRHYVFDRASEVYERSMPSASPSRSSPLLVPYGSRRCTTASLERARCSASDPAGSDPCTSTACRRLTRRG